MEEKIYICLTCEKEYNSYMGLWKHKKNKHKEKIIKNSKECKYCNKLFSDRSNRWRHENSICKLKNINEKIENKDLPNINNSNNNDSTVNSNNTNTYSNNNESIVNSHNLTSNDNSNIIQNNIKNQTINNITINNIGSEDINILTQEEIEEIINNGFNCVIKLIELINFNKQHPQNHSFCTTNLNNKYTSVINTESNEIDKKRKIDVFDKVLFYALNHIEMLKDKITNNKKKKEFNDRIIEYNKKIFGDNEYKKIFIEQLNELSYNKKTMVRNTWDNYLKNILVLNL
jgi:hypothetical protein